MSNKFEKGDKVKILGNIRQTGLEGFIESIDASNEDLTYYNIMDINKNTIAYDISENILERLETNMFEKVITNCFDNDNAYIEGVRNHMIEAEIDPTINNPKDYIYFQEMAGRLPDIKVDKKGKEILIVAIGARENRGEAHFHVYRSETDLEQWKNGACLLFKDNKYFDHADNSETLTRDELFAIIECLRSKPSKNKYPGDTNWEVILGLWNMNNPKWEINIDTPMPDYDYETITRYKEKEEK